MATRRILPSRRQIIHGAAATAGLIVAPAIWKRAEAVVCPLNCPPGSSTPQSPVAALDAPTLDFSLKQRIIAGVRPHRERSYRLGRRKPDEPGVTGKYIVHNYGHGGAGITMSWGCATEVVKHVQNIISTEGSAAASNGIVILGSGVMGLTAATLLSGTYPQTKIRVLTERPYGKTTSMLAGGQWCPASVDRDGNEAEFERILRASHAAFKIQIGQGFGVSEMDNYVIERPRPGKSFRLLPDLTPETCHVKLPIKGMNCLGFSYKTLLVEPPIFLRKLRHDLMRPNVSFKLEKITSLEHLKNQPEKIVINCTGMGSKSLFGDEDMKPIKGQLTLLRPQRNLKYLFSGYDGKTTGEECHDWVQYVFPRQDALVVGGTYEEGKGDERANEITCKSLLDHLKPLFAGHAPSCAGYPNHGL